MTEWVNLFMKVDQVSLKLVDLFVREAVIFSIDMCSVRRFFHCVTLRRAFDFQFRRTVFLAIARAVYSALDLWWLSCSVERSPKIQRLGDKGMRQPSREDK